MLAAITNWQHDVYRPDIMPCSETEINTITKLSGHLNSPD